MVNEVEASAQRVCDHLQRPDHPDRQLTNAKVRSAVNQTVPESSRRGTPRRFRGRFAAYCCCSSVTQQTRSAAVTEVQEETLQTIRSLVSDGLFELGDLSGEGGSLVAWSG